jgi:uncharacterized protein YbjT (DUF2867 family)
MQNLLNYQGDSIRQEGAFYLGQGQGRVSFIDIRYVGRAAWALAQRYYDGTVS